MEHPLHKGLAPVIAAARYHRTVIPGVIFALLDIGRLRADLGTGNTEDLICAYCHLFAFLHFRQTADAHQKRQHSGESGG